MPSAPSQFRPGWRPPVAKSETDKQVDRYRGSARQRGYDGRWEKARLTFLSQHPLCICCTANGHVCAASIVDHIEPHKGDQVKFWDVGNWQPLCEWCDKHLKRRIENGFLAGRVPRGDLRLDRVVISWRAPSGR